MLVIRLLQQKLEHFGRTGSIQYGSLFQQIIYSHAIDFAWVRIESATLVLSKYRKLVLLSSQKNNSTWSFNLLKLWLGAVCSWPHCRGKYLADLKLQRCNWGEVWVRIHDDVIKWKNWNIFRVTGYLCGEFTGPRWIPHTKASNVEFWCFLWSVFE